MSAAGFPSPLQLAPALLTDRGLHAGFYQAILSCTTLHIMLFPKWNKVILESLGSLAMKENRPLSYLTQSVARVSESSGSSPLQDKNLHYLIKKPL
jgi:hypothetical protein